MEVSVSTTPIEIVIPAGVQYRGTIRNADLTLEEWSNIAGAYVAMPDTPVAAGTSFLFSNGGENGKVRLTGSANGTFSFHKDRLEVQ